MTTPLSAGRWQGVRDRARSFVTADRLGDASVATLLFLALVLVRTADIAETMWLLGDQIRDWKVALLPIDSLPLTGAPSAAGGTSLGPFYYWLLWLIRVVVGPWLDNLPHAGAIGLAFFHAAADVVFYFALRRFSGSATLALATVLLLATAPRDLALSSTIWSPPVAVSLVKLALAMFLINADRPSRRRMAATVAIAWLAVQTHSSAVLVFLPIATWFVVRELAGFRWRAAIEAGRLIVEIVLVMQIPYFIDWLTAATPRHAPTVILEGIATLVANPATARPAHSFAVITSILADLWSRPFAVAWLPWLLGAAALGTLVVARRRPAVVFVALLPLATAVIGFAAWTRPWESYWFLGLAPAVALMVALGVCALPEGRVREAAALSFLGLVLYAQPPRLAAAAGIHRLPEFGPLIQGTRTIARQTTEVGAIVTTFALPRSTDPAFPFICMGGRLSSSALYDAVIARDGAVTFRPRQ